MRNYRKRIADDILKRKLEGKGAVLTGVFAVSALCGVGGLLEGNVLQFAVQLLDAGVAAGYSFAVTFALAWIINKTLGLRVSHDEEYVGMDMSQHGEQAHA